MLLTENGSLAIAIALTSPLRHIRRYNSGMVHQNDCRNPVSRVAEEVVCARGTSQSPFDEEITGKEAHRMPRERQRPPVEYEQDGEDFFDD